MNLQITNKKGQPVCVVETNLFGNSFIKIPANVDENQFIVDDLKFEKSTRRIYLGSQICDGGSSSRIVCQHPTKKDRVIKIDRQFLAPKKTRVNQQNIKEFIVYNKLLNGIGPKRLHSFCMKIHGISPNNALLSCEYILGEEDSENNVSFDKPKARGSHQYKLDGRIQRALRKTLKETNANIWYECDLHAGNFLINEKGMAKVIDLGAFLCLLPHNLKNKDGY
jgi:hypothetical protein